jgi:hypothetical protein
MVNFPLGITETKKQQNNIFKEIKNANPGLAE